MFTSFLLPRGPRNALESGSRIERPARMNAPDIHRVTVRLAEPADREALRRVAELDSAQVPEGELVVAEVAGSIQAALPVAGGPTIANPFVPTADLVKLLEVRAKHLRDAGVGGGQVILLRRRVRLADRPA
jgi:hypothetical protein